MKITSFQISTDRTVINLTITDAATVTSLLFWTDVTYRNYSEAIDLSSKLTGAVTENIVITLADLSLSYFDGVYFIEAEDPDELSSAITADLTRYKECILGKVLNSINCEDCLDTISNSALNAQVLLYSLETAIENSFIDEISLILTTLKKYCSDTCKSCGEYKNIVDINYYTT